MTSCKHLEKKNELIEVGQHELHRVFYNRLMDESVDIYPRLGQTLVSILTSNRVCPRQHKAILQFCNFVMHIWRLAGRLLLRQHRLRIVELPLVQLAFARLAD